MGLMCKRGDRDVPELICGYPLPCPWHTVIMDETSTPPTITIPATIYRAIRPDMLRLLKEIANAIKPDSIKRDPQVKKPRRRRRASTQTLR